MKKKQEMKKRKKNKNGGKCTQRKENKKKKNNKRVKEFLGRRSKSEQRYLEGRVTCRFLICCSISRAFRGFLPNISNPEVSRSSRWIVRRFFRPNSWKKKLQHQEDSTSRTLTFARMKTTVLCLYLPHGWTCRRMRLESKMFGRLAVHTTARPASSRLR